MSIKKAFLYFALMLFSSYPRLYAQGTAGESAKYEYRYLIDMPTAGVLEKGFVGVTSDIMPDGVFITYLEVGIFKRVSFGISYGGSNVIGSGSVNWYKLPAVNLRIRLLNESITVPALTIGFDSQGKGLYFDDANRYAYKSPGDRKSTRLNSSHIPLSRMPSSA